MAAITLAEFSKTVQDPFRRGIIETSYEDEPIYGLWPWRTVKGLALPYNQEETLPSVSFRNINEAFTPTVGVYNRLIETLKPMGGESDTDTVLVDAYGVEERTGRDDRFAKAMAVTYIQTAIYGNSGTRTGNAYDDVKGFDGIIARMTAGQTLDAGGSGADGSSVIAIRFGDGYVQGLQTPKGLEARDLGELESKPAFRSRIDHTCGMAIYHGRAVGWIKDITAAAPVTVALMNSLRDLIVGAPSLYAMTKRSRQQLWTSATGLGVSLGVRINELGQPVETWNNVPIYVTDAMIDTETAP